MGGKKLGKIKVRRDREGRWKVKAESYGGILEDRSGAVGGSERESVLNGTKDIKYVEESPGLNPALLKSI